MSIELEMVAPSRVGVQASALLDACEAYCAALEGLPQLQAMAGQTGLLVTVVFDGKRERRLWGIPGNAVGYHAVRSESRGAGQGMVADTLEAHVCLDLMLADLEGCWDGLPPEERVDRVSQWMTTIAHEVLHALHWGLQSCGRTPAQVERAEGIQGLVRVGHALFDRMCPAANWRPADGERTRQAIEARVEILVESWAREMTRACLPPVVCVLAGMDWSDIGRDIVPARGLG